MSPVVVGKRGSRQGVKLLLDGGVDPQHEVANGHGILFKPFVTCLLVGDYTLCVNHFSRSSSDTHGMSPKAQRHEKGPHRTRPDFIVGTVKDGNKLRDIVRHCYL